MGLFSKSKESKFKDLFVDYMNLLASVSYREISIESAAPRITEYKRDLIFLARQFSDPCTSYFKLYSSQTTVLGEKTSIAEGVVIALLALEYVTSGHRLSNSAQNWIVNQARIQCSTVDGRNATKELILKSNP